MKLDGAGYFKTYWREMMPLAAPHPHGGSVRSSPFWGCRRALLGEPAAGGRQLEDYTVRIGARAGPLPCRTDALTHELISSSATIAIVPVLVVYVVLPAVLRGGSGG